MNNGVIEVDPQKVGGVPVFAGTRVPIQNLFDYIEGGETLEDFIEGFPPITREQAVAVLEMAVGEIEKAFTSIRKREIVEVFHPDLKQ